jgi:hypothetical protein
MSLYNFHRVLISAAILFDFGFTFWALREYQRTGDQLQLFMAIGTSVVTVLLVAYLVYFNRNLAVMRHILGDRPMPARGINGREPRVDGAEDSA